MKIKQMCRETVQEVRQGLPILEGWVLVWNRTKPEGVIPVEVKQMIKSLLWVVVGFIVIWIVLGLHSWWEAVCLTGAVYSIAVGRAKISNRAMNQWWLERIRKVQEKIGEGK